MIKKYNIFEATDPDLDNRLISNINSILVELEDIGYETSIKINDLGNQDSSELDISIKSKEPEYINIDEVDDTIKTIIDFVKEYIKDKRVYSSNRPGEPVYNFTFIKSIHGATDVVRSTSLDYGKANYVKWVKTNYPELLDNIKDRFEPTNLSVIRVRLSYGYPKYPK